MPENKDRNPHNDDFSEDSIEDLLDSKMIEDKDADEYDSGIITIQSTADQKNGKRESERQPTGSSRILEELEKEKQKLLDQNSNLKGEIIDLKIKVNEMQDGYDKLLEGNTILQNKLNDEIYQKKHQIEMLNKEFDEKLADLKKQHEEEIGGIYLEHKEKEKARESVKDEYEQRLEKQQEAHEEEIKTLKDLIWSSKREKEELLDREESFNNKINGLTEAKESLSQKILSLENELEQLKKDQNDKIKEYRKIFAEIENTIQKLPDEEPPEFEIPEEL